MSATDQSRPPSLMGRRPPGQPNLRLRRLRVNNGMSRLDLARLAGVGQETVRLSERGYDPTPRVQFRLAGVFGLVPTDIWPLEAGS